MDISQIIDLSIYGVAAFFVLVGMLLGLIRGFKRQTMRFISIIASVALSYVGCKLLMPILINAIGTLSVEQVLGMVGLSGDIVALLGGVDSQTLTCIVALPTSLLIVPLLTIPMFYIVAFIFELLHKIFCGILGFTRRNNNAFTRILGLVIGAAEGVILALVVIVPVTGIVSVASGAIAHIEEKHPDSANTKALSAMYDAYVGCAEENIIIKLTDSSLSFASDMFVTVDVNGVSVKTPDAVNTALGMFVKYGDLTGVNWVLLSDENKADMTEIKDYLSADPYCSMLASGLLRTVGAMGVDTLPIKLEAPFDQVLVSLLEVFSTSDGQNIGGDLNTAFDLYFLLSDESVLKTAADGGDIVNALLEVDENGSSVFSRLIDVISKNERMTGVVNTLVEISVRLLLEQSGFDGDALETIENVKNGLNEILAIDRDAYSTEEEYREAVSESLDATLRDNGIGLEGEQLKAVSDFVIDEFGGVENISDAEIAEFMAKYYDIYAG